MLLSAHCAAADSVLKGTFSFCSRLGSPSVQRFTTENPEVDAKPPADMYTYKMNYPSLGQCVIINNKNFDKHTGRPKFVRCIFVHFTCSGYDGMSDFCYIHFIGCFPLKE